MLILAGCAKSENTNANGPADEDTVAVATPNDAVTHDTIIFDSPADVEARRVEQAQTAMLRELLSENGGEDEAKLRKHCTRNAIRQLVDDYDYDDTDGTHLAIWAINGRMESCDAPIQLAALNKVAPDTYQAAFTIQIQEGKKDTSLMEYKLAEENGQWKIDHYRQISYK